jgi:hypothetical protein
MAQADDAFNGNRPSITGASVKLATDPVRAAHAEFVTALAAHPPWRIPLFPDTTDLEDRADQLKFLLKALTSYITALLDDTARNVPGGFDVRHVEALLSDLTSEAVGVVQQAADELVGRVE